MCGDWLGVLSIASSLPSAKEISTYDLDDVAVSVAQESSELQLWKISCCCWRFVGCGAEADVIVANILADILIHLTEDAYRLVKDEGYLIMSGIIRTSGTWCAELAESQLVFP